MATKSPLASDPHADQLKQVFVISPIGKRDEEGFDFTELFLEEIVKPAAAAAGGFDIPVRADKIRKHGSITAKVIVDIVNANVCIADLTQRNPNVMYEVAIAHAADKPVILLQQETGGGPFDFADERVIHYGTRADLASAARAELTDYLRNVEHEKEDPQLQENIHPVRKIFRDLQTVQQAAPSDQAILEGLAEISRRVDDLASMQARLVSSAARDSLGGLHPSPSARRYLPLQVQAELAGLSEVNLRPSERKLLGGALQALEDLGPTGAEEVEKTVELISQMRRRQGRDVEHTTLP